MLLRLEAARPRSRISLTALIDVVFILLLFFMLTTQFTRWRSLDVPLADEASARTETRPLDVALDAGGGLRVGAARIAPGSSCAAEARSLLGGPTLPVLLRPAADVRVQPVMDALDCLRRAGATELLLADATVAEH